MSSGELTDLKEKTLFQIMLVHVQNLQIISMFVLQYIFFEKVWNDILLMIMHHNDEDLPCSKVDVARQMTWFPDVSVAVGCLTMFNNHQLIRGYQLKNMA